MKNNARKLGLMASLLFLASTAFADGEILVPRDSCVLNVGKTTCRSSVYYDIWDVGVFGVNRVATSCTFSYSMLDKNTGEVSELSKTKQLVYDSGVNENGFTFIVNLLTMDGLDGLNVQMLKLKQKHQLKKMLEFQKEQLSYSACG